MSKTDFFPVHRSNFWSDSLLMPLMSDVHCQTNCRCTTHHGLCVLFVV